MQAITANALSQVIVDTKQPTPLFSENGHAIYWLGIPDETAFRCNAYFIKDGDEAIIVDPGNKIFFEFVKKRVAQIMDPKKVMGQILCHQDPDVAASMPDWLQVNPKMKVFSTSRAQVLLLHYGATDYDFYDITAEPEFTFSSGNTLKFIEAPFLHFPGAFVTYDVQSRYLFSGDVWAALDIDWTLVVEDFAYHAQKMDLFNVDYMASNLATRGFIKRLKNMQLPIDAILPQHGSIMGKQYVQSALDYLENLKCGLDIIYADLVE
ncbi:MAG: MBL fold metallo-hydrolase [Gammaproteobacteria bacterium]|nr:MBL fold metallo-hydrolase [Gammaproteobacteria bacterium]MBU2546763.1 MBL fold metallo-hydrolase [Gammaproteobacteria bacterium]